MEIPFEGTLTEKQYTAVYRRVVGQQLRPFVPFMVLFLIVTFVTPSVLNRAVDDTASLGSVLPLIIVPLGFVVMLAAVFFGGARQAWAQQPPSVRVPVRGALTAEGLLWSSEVAESRFKWAAFTRYVETAELLLLYQGGTFTIMPRDFFAGDEAWEAARALVRANVSTR